MPNAAQNRFAWVKSGLFWRTFFLLALLLTASMTVWFASVRAVERTPRARQMAAQIISIVTITRAALTHSASDSRRELLFDLASNEGIRVYPLESDDEVAPVKNTDSMILLQEYVSTKLGSDTRFARKVNEVAGFWVSFKIDGDAYWLMLDRERIDRSYSMQLLGWAAMTLLLALLGAVFISRLINQPLARLTAATRSIAKGEPLAPLPETGSTEIMEANRSFNQMVEDLQRIESDRAIILAGISHDLRTPLARMQLEVEMATLSSEAREGMQSDLGQMDAIIGQFLDYAKPSDPSKFTKIDISALLEQSANEARRLPDVAITTALTPGISVMGNPVDLQRVVNNLIENARRYGKNPDTNVAHIDIACRREASKVIVEIGDHGAGIPTTEMAQLLRPFTRLDSARSQANGAGLGLAIVSRAIKRHGGELQLSNRPDGGLLLKIMLWCA